MELFQTIHARRSIRSFLPEEVPVQVLRAMVEAAFAAPSINDSRLLSAVAVTRRELIAQMAEVVRRRLGELEIEDKQVHRTVEHFSTLFENAPALLVFARRPYEALIDKALGGSLSPEAVNAMRGYPDLLSVGAAVENALLAATALGYDSCWLSGPLLAGDALAPLLDVQPPALIASLIAVGKRASEPKKREPVELAQRFTLLS
ncbi:MAG: nitroreductase family protein [Myxococcota bacterium]|jgi:nitroreductase|nr:nitroreductase family protein [Myxococcota bacterium]